MFAPARNSVTSIRSLLQMKTKQQTTTTITRGTKGQIPQLSLLCAVECKVITDVTAKDEEWKSRDRGYGMERRVARAFVEMVAKYHAVIVCDEKLSSCSLWDETLIFNGDGCNKDMSPDLNTSSRYTKAQSTLLEDVYSF
ncbi:hypothetical protein Tco_0975415 [Tanacetum coccineum]|uniref:Uncharacterized protein n=1 Tax=Tanacetum coccineum TaxID=301880 RepID=A0ABQ5EEE6_9ASTR